MKEILMMCWPFWLVGGMMAAGMICRVGWLKW